MKKTLSPELQQRIRILQQQGYRVERHEALDIVFYPDESINLWHPNDKVRTLMEQWEAAWEHFDSNR